MVQELTPRHEQQRLDFSRWFLEQGRDFPRKLIVNDEKMFYLRPLPNRKNTGYYAYSNPNILADVKNQAAEKRMCLILIDLGEGKILEPFWFEDEEGRSITQNGPRYLNALQNHFMPQFTQRTLRRRWWQQDGILFLN